MAADSKVSATAVTKKTKFSLVWCCAGELTHLGKNTILDIKEVEAETKLGASTMIISDPKVIATMVRAISAHCEDDDGILWNNTHWKNKKQVKSFLSSLNGAAFLSLLSQTQKLSENIVFFLLASNNPLYRYLKSLK